MNSLGDLKRYLERSHRKLGAIVALLGLLTYYLKHNYVGQQRDLLYWMDLLTLVNHHPFIFCLFVLATLISQLLLLMAHQRIDLGMRVIISELVRKYRERKFADFIVRRLLWHLELAMLRMPQTHEQDLFNDPTLQQRLQLAKDSAYRAVDIFRRDAAALLLDQLPLSGEADRFFILKEEEVDLLNAGYSTIRLRVNHDVLRQLLYPQSKNLD